MEKNQIVRDLDNIVLINSEGKTILMLPEKVVSRLENMHYKVFGHSAVQICGWNKKAVKGEGVCYKTKFYGIDCHKCMEMSPSAMWCQENCTFCWRPMEFMKNINVSPNQVDEPKKIIENLTFLRTKLLSGFGGNDKVNQKFLADSKIPSHYAISLSGEPTMYPKLPEMVKYLKTLNETKSVFIVTNAQIPEFFQRILDDKLSQPTQLYISLEAPNEKVFENINKSLYKNGFARLKQSLSIFAKLETRKVLRFTLIKGINNLEEQFLEYKNLVDLSNTDFIEIKSYMHLGMSQNRHSKAQMLEFVEVEDFCKRFCKFLGNFEYISSSPNSRIVLIRRKDSPFGMRIF